MKLIFHLFFALWLLYDVHGATGLDFGNCSSMVKNLTPPVLIVFVNPILDKSGSVEIVSGNTVKLECHASYPIQLVFDASEQSTVGNVWSNVLHRNSPNLSTTGFQLHREVKFNHHVKNETIVCVSVDSPCLQHRLQVSNISADGSKLRLELMKSTTKGLSLPDSQTVAINTTDKCEALFYYEEFHDAYKFRCKFADGTPGEIKKFDCGTSLGCNDILRKGQLQTECWSPYFLKACDGCKATERITHFVPSVTVCTKNGRESEIGSLVFFGVTSTKNVAHPKIFFSPDVLKKITSESVSESEPFITIVELEPQYNLASTVDVECRAAGFAAAANIQWALEFKGDSQLKYLDANPSEVKWHIYGNYRYQNKLLGLNDAKLKKIHCFAPIENTYKWLHATRAIHIQDPSRIMNHNITIILGLVIPVLIIIGILIGILLWRTNRLKNVLRNLTEEEIKLFKYGNVNIDPNDYHSPIHGRPFNSALEIPRELLELDEKCILGSGQYGIVMKGYILDKSKVESSTGKDLVAVKTVKSDVDVETFKALLSEIKIMGYLEKHENVVGLLGACTADIKERKVLAAIEFCGNGDLLGYIRKRRTSFKNLLEPIQFNTIPCENTNVTSSAVEYENMPLTTLDLLKFAKGVANGMNYLTIKNVIHGDLAARNVLLTDTLEVKISDFGLSRQLLQYSNYVKTQQIPLPYKWLAIESLKDMEFSIKSDVWSFGVVLWELFSLGENPYPGYSWTHEFLDQLTSGYRMKRPDFANDPIYDIMLDCWRISPDARPSFNMIHSQILQMIMDLTNKTNAEC